MFIRNEIPRELFGTLFDTQPKIMNLMRNKARQVFTWKNDLKNFGVFSFCTKSLGLVNWLNLVHGIVHGIVQ